LKGASRIDARPAAFVRGPDPTAFWRAGRHAANQQLANDGNDGQSSRPQRETRPVTFFDRSSWQGVTSINDEIEVLPTGELQQQDYRNGPSLKTGRITRLRARQRRSQEPPRTCWEEITWLVASLRDMITKQNHTIEEISSGQKALKAQNEKIQTQNDT
jgi:hypothetical protein